MFWGSRGFMSSLERPLEGDGEGAGGLQIWSCFPDQGRIWTLKSPYHAPLDTIPLGKGATLSPLSVQKSQQLLLMSAVH